MTSLRTQISNYTPRDQHERSDQALFLRCLDIFPDVLTRNNTVCHVVSSCWLINQAHTKALMLFHNIEQKWMWPGGHADGEANLSSVALREAQEETGLTDIRLLSDQIFSLEVFAVPPHIRHDNFVSTHLHLNCSYILEANDAEAFRIKPDENSAIRWIDFTEIIASIKQGKMDILYQKLINKTKENYK